MKAKPRRTPGELRPEYEFDYTTAVRGKYYRRMLEQGATVIVLEPDVARAFRTSAAVNEALRTLLEVSESMRRLRARPGGRTRTPRPRSSGTPSGR